MYVNLMVAVVKSYMALAEPESEVQSRDAQLLQFT